MEKSKNKLRAPLVLSTLLVLSISGAILFYSKGRSAIADRDRALLRSDSLFSSALSIQKKVDYLSSNLNATDEKLTASEHSYRTLSEELTTKKKELDQLKNSQGALTRKKLDNALRMNSEYKQRVETLSREISRLESALSEKSGNLALLEGSHKDLQGKLDKYSRLRAYEMNIQAYKNSRITKRARKTNRIRINFLISENELANAGTKEITVVLIDPQGKIISDHARKFENKDTQQEQVYTDSKSIQYNNQDMKSAVDVTCNCKLQKGGYKAEVYVDGILAGKKEFELR